MLPPCTTRFFSLCHLQDYSSLQGKKQPLCFLPCSIYCNNNASFFPHKTPNMQHATLNATYNPPCIYNRSSNNLYASSENVEKVVKPPHTPVFQKRILFWDISSLVLTIPTTKPINIAPIIFVTSVRNGNAVFAGIKLIAYLPIAPTAPPNATQKKSISFFLPVILNTL